VNSQTGDLWFRRQHVTQGGLPNLADPIEKIVADNIRRLRDASNLSLSQVALRAGMSKATLSSLESATGNPTVQTLSSVAGALGCTLAELITSQVPQVVLLNDAQWVNGDGFKGRLAARMVGQRAVDVHEIVFGRGVSLRDTPLPGSIEHLFVLAGEVTAESAGSSARLKVGDGMTFLADSEYVISCTRDSRVLLFVATSETGTSGPFTAQRPAPPQTVKKAVKKKSTDA
jgi:transcriptional regulator with XRE-family HTH domain